MVSLKHLILCMCVCVCVCVYSTVLLLRPPLPCLARNSSGSGSLGTVLFSFFMASILSMYSYTSWVCARMSRTIWSYAAQQSFSSFVGGGCDGGDGGTDGGGDGNGGGGEAGAEGRGEGGGGEGGGGGGGGGECTSNVGTSTSSLAVVKRSSSGAPLAPSPAVAPNATIVGARLSVDVGCTRAVRESWSIAKPQQNATTCKGVSMGERGGREK